MSASQVPQFDPGAGYRAQQSAIDAAVKRVLGSGWYILGAEVEAYEAEFAAFIGVRHAIGVANGTDALALALRALGLRAGQRVVTVSHTAVATAAAIEMAGGAPLLVDIDERYAMAPAALEAALEAEREPPAAIIAVHLYGQPAALDAVAALAQRHGIPLIEDCAQCHGARIGARRAGSIGALGCFSFYPTKNLGAFGDGGAIVTDDDALAERLRALRQYGWRQRYVSDIAGVNSRLDELQAAILRVRLAALDGDNAERQRIAARYDEGLRDLPLALPARRAGTSHAFHQYVVRSGARDALKAALGARGVGTNIHYPVPVHLQPAYRGRVALGPGGLSRSEAAAREVLSLPMYPQLADDAVERVIAALRETTVGLPAPGAV
jgi:dTDP-4-amino-4,6-dideoxygalactose transaminase